MIHLKWPVLNGPYQRDGPLFRLVSGQYVSNAELVEMISLLEIARGLTSTSWHIFLSAGSPDSRHRWHLLHSIFSIQRDRQDEPLPSFPIIYGLGKMLFFVIGKLVWIAELLCNLEGWSCQFWNGIHSWFGIHSGFGPRFDLTSGPFLSLWGDMTFAEVEHL